MTLLELNHMRVRKIYLFFIIILINFVVYFPALHHIPRSDHELFLSETADSKSLKDLIANTYSYPRTRLFEPGREYLPTMAGRDLELL